MHKNKLLALNLQTHGCCIRRGGAMLDGTADRFCCGGEVEHAPECIVMDVQRHVKQAIK